MDSMGHCGTQYYRLKWKDRGEWKYSKIKQLGAYDSGFYYEMESGVLKAENPAMPVRSIRAIGFDGAILRKWERPALPLRMGFPVHCTGVYLEIIFENGQVTRMKIPLI